MTPKARFIILSLFLFSGYQLIAQHTIKGVVTEKNTKEPLLGTVIGLIGTSYYTTSGLDGSYVLKNIPTGTYEVEVRFISYETLNQSITIESNTQLNFELFSKDFSVGEIEIRATRDLSSEQSARKSEKLSMNVINVISSKEIEVSPDITVANVIQRVSGVSLERNSNGDGQYAIVRGMDKRYNYTLVNGIKIPSPDPKNRYVPLDIFPSDLLDRLEVTKALTPDMEGDAIGGVIDMKMKNAPDRFTLNVNVGTGYNQLFVNNPFRTFDKKASPRLSPRISNGQGSQASIEDFKRGNIDFYDRTFTPNQVYGLSIGNRFFNNKFGVIVAGSYQNTFRGANSMFMTTFIDQEKNTPYYEILHIRKFSNEQVRAGVHAKLDYVINNDHKLDLYLSTISLNDFETRSQIDTIIKIGRGQGPGTGRIELRERSRQTYQKIYNTTLQGSHKFSDAFKGDWSAVYSLATNDDPDMAELKWITAVRRNNNGELIQDPIMYDTDYKRRWMNNRDQDLAGYVNFSYKPQGINMPLEFKSGGMFRYKNRKSNFDEYLFRTIPIMQEWTGDVNDASWDLFNTIGTPTAPLNYRCNENIAAAYGMFKLEYEKFHALGGARFENTSFNWESDAPITVDGRTGSIKYFDLLPSLHLKYMPDSKQNIRLSYFSSISRPSFYEVIPYEINEDDFRERGNPFLKRTSANNLDLRYEFFSSFLDKIMVGTFYKRIVDPIESSLVISGQNVFLQPNNFGNAQNFGIEIDVVRYLKNFGVRMFYTFTQSEITTSKIVRFRDENGNLTSRQEEQTRPLQGQSKHISNVSFLYKNQKSGTDIQLAMVYTGRRIISVSPYLDNDIWQRGFVQLDFSIEQEIKKGFTIYAKINNLLNTPTRADILLPNTFNAQQAPQFDASTRTMVMEDFYAQTYFIGLKYRFTKND
jgi:hypothetical protein